MAGYDGYIRVKTSLDNTELAGGAQRFKAALGSLKGTVDRVSSDAEASARRYAKAVVSSIRSVDELTGKAKLMHESLRGKGTNSAEYKQLVAEINRTRAAYERLIEREDRFNALGVDVNSAAWDRLAYDIDTTREKLIQLESVRRRVESGGGGRSSIGAAFAGIARGAANAGAAVAKFAGRGALSFLKKLAAGAKNAAVQFAKLAASAAKSGFKKLGATLFHIGQGARASGNGFNFSLKNLLKYGLGIRSLFVLFNRLRAAITEGLVALAKQSPAVDSAINSLKAALNGLKGSLATAFAPILTAVAPALTMLINMLATAISYVGAFIAALTGQKTYMRAVGTLGAVAGGIGSAGDAAKGASGAVKELKRQLAGFDQLDILSANDTSGGGGSGGGGGGSGAGGTGVEFESVPIDSGIIDFIDRMKAMFAAGDYDAIGSVIASGINRAFEKAKSLISWNSVGATVTKYVDAFCGILNGMVVKVDWELIGGTFGAGIDTIIRTVNRLVYGLHDFFLNAGTGIGRALNAMVDDIPWDTLGDTIGQYFENALGFIYNAISEFDINKAITGLTTALNKFVKRATESITSRDFEAIGDKIGEALNTMVSGIEWEHVGDLLVAMIGTPLAALKRAIIKFEFGEAGEKFGKMLNRFFTNKELWRDLGHTLGELCKGALDWLNSAVDEFDWVELGNNIYEMIRGMDWPGILSRLVDGIDTIFSGLMTALFTSLKNLWLDSLADLIDATPDWLWWLITGGGSKAEYKDFLARNNTSTREILQNAYGGSGSSSKTVGPGGQADRSTGVGRNKTGTNIFERTWGGAKSLRDQLSEGLTGITAEVTTEVDGTKNASGARRKVNKAYASGGGVKADTDVTFNGSHGGSGGSFAPKRNLESGLSGSQTDVDVSLKKRGWTSISAFVGTSVRALVTLAKADKNQTLVGLIGNSLKALVTLAKKDKNQTLPKVIGDTLKAKVDLAFGSISNGVQSFFRLVGFKFASGGAITDGGSVKRFASGGVVSRSGRASWWDGVNKYAGGTTRAHGTVFVAGENGPEIMGHVNGRTEILNKSQLAQAIYGAVVSGMGQAVNALGRFVGERMATCTNAIISNLSALRGGGVDTGIMAQMSALAASPSYRVPAMASGGVLPYEVAATITRTGQEIRRTIQDTNEDLIQTLVSVMGAQTNAIVAALQQLANNGGSGDGGYAQRAIDEINRRTRMLGASPINGV